MNLLNAPKLKKHLSEYIDPFRLEWEYRYKENMSFGDFLHDTVEGQIILKNIMTAEGLSYADAYAYQRTADKIVKLEQERIKKELQKKRDAVILKVKRELKKQGTYETLYEYGECIIFENGEKVFEDFYYKGEHYYYCKEGWDLKTSILQKAINKALEEAGL